MHKRGGLKPAGKRQESATFLQRSFFGVAVQFFVCCSAAFGPNDFRTAEKPMLQCSFCSAAFRKLQRNFRFRWWHVAGWGLEGWGLRLAEEKEAKKETNPFLAYFSLQMFYYCFPLFSSCFLGISVFFLSHSVAGWRGRNTTKKKKDIPQAKLLVAICRDTVVDKQITYH